MWKFAGSPKNRDPYFWCRQVETQRFIESECKLLKTDRKSVLKTKRGKFGGTYASNRILLEYARYLDKDLAVIVNEVFLQEVAAQQNPDMYLDKYRNAYKRKGKDDAWISERMKVVGVRKELTATLGTHGVHDNGFRECTNASYTGLFGMNAPAIRSALNIEKKDSIRDNLDKTQLLALSLSESLANDDIKGRNLWGVEQCSQSCHDAAHTIYGAVMKFKQR